MSNLTALQVFQDEVYSQTTELIAEQVNLFNQASDGCIVLVPNAVNQGDFTKEAYWKKVSGLVRRRDPYDRSSTVSAVNIEQLLAVAVKVAAGTPPINIDPDTLRWIQRAPTEYAAVLADQLAQDMLGDMLGSGLGAFIAATRNAGNDNPLFKDVTNGANTGTTSMANLNATARLMGDRASAIRCWVMHSAPMHDLYAEALSNSNQLFMYGDVAVRADAWGRRFIVTDDASLISSGSPEGYNTCGLVQSGIVVQQNNDYEDNIETSNGKESLSRTWQAQWSYNVGVKGYKWNTSVTAPTDAELVTEGNWTKIATSAKDCAGVLMLSD